MYDFFDFDSCFKLGNIFNRIFTTRPVVDANKISIVEKISLEMYQYINKTIPHPFASKLKCVSEINDIGKLGYSIGNTIFINTAHIAHIANVITEISPKISYEYYVYNTVLYTMVHEFFHIYQVKLAPQILYDEIERINERVSMYYTSKLMNNKHNLYIKELLYIINTMFNTYFEQEIPNKKIYTEEFNTYYISNPVRKFWDIMFHDNIDSVWNNNGFGYTKNYLMIYCGMIDKFCKFGDTFKNIKASMAVEESTGRRTYEGYIKSNGKYDTDQINEFINIYSPTYVGEESFDSVFDHDKATNTLTMGIGVVYCYDPVVKK